MRTEKLLSINILGKKEDEKKVISQLQHLGIVHIQKAKPTQGMELQGSLEGVEEIAKTLLSLRFIADRVENIPHREVSLLPDSKVTLQRAKKFLNTHLEEVRVLARKHEDLQEAYRAKETRILAKKTKEAKLLLGKALGKEKKELGYLLSILQSYYEQHTIGNSFLHSSELFYLEGFVSKSDFRKIRIAIPQVVITINEAVEGPSKLKERPIASKFQLVIKLFDYPKYGSIDPTLFVAFFYPLFFGFMLSDVGYGLMLLGLIFLFKNKLGAGFPILFISAISTILFGFVFGSFFGELIPLPALWGDSFALTESLLIVSLAIGLIHINLGVLLRMIQQRKEKKKLIGALAIPCLELALLSFALAYVPLGGFLLAGAIGLFIFNNSWLGILDITGFFGTWFSYARLLALNLATAGIALAINVMAEQLFTLGALGFIAGIFLLIGGHIFNFVINIIGTTINAARLQYVEFFSLFFEGGGIPFSPFSINGGKQWK